MQPIDPCTPLLSPQPTKANHSRPIPPFFPFKIASPSGHHHWHLLIARFLFPSQPTSPAADQEPCLLIPSPSSTREALPISLVTSRPTRRHTSFASADTSSSPTRSSTHISSHSSLPFTVVATSSLLLCRRLNPPVQSCPSGSSIIFRHSTPYNVGRLPSKSSLLLTLITPVAPKTAADLPFGSTLWPPSNHLSPSIHRSDQSTPGLLRSGEFPSPHSLFFERLAFFPHPSVEPPA